ncbi:hypothetical protein BD769DRAFT_1382914 [Suillus cothurnatus]|nr:hypothetical protein BD769DRAFT_1382914 [Suillus cothurnatus]
MPQSHNEAALLVWLQTQGRDILPESLVITASVVFGLVDAHDLIALIDMCLKEVAMTECIGLKEVSLFSNAIANLCDELQNRNHSNCVNRFQPTQATQDKCNAWLLTSSHVQGIMQVDPDTIRALLDSPKMDFPDLPESLLRPDDLLSLPRLLKTWVDNVTYRAYMNASFGERRAPRIVDSKDFQTKDHKSEEILKSDVRVLDLKKRRAQAEVDMFFGSHGTPV